MEGMSRVHPFSADETGVYSNRPMPVKTIIDSTDGGGAALETGRPSADSLLFSRRLGIFAGDLSIVGLKQVFGSSASYFRRGVWLSLVLFGLGFMSFQVVKQTGYYLQRPTRVDVNVRYNDTLRFPTVTICNENRIMKSKLHKLDPALMPQFAKLYPPFPLEVPPDFTGINLEGNWTEKYIEMSQTKYGAIVKASFGGKDIEADHFDAVLTNMGYCFQFNGPRSKGYYAQRGGAVHGLKVVLFVGQNEYFALSDFGQASAGFRIALHSPDEVPFMKEQSFKIGPGFHSLVSLSMVNVTDTGPPYVQCKQEPGYTKGQCLADCEYNYAFEKCACKDIYMSGDAPVCDPKVTYDCLQPAMEAYILENGQLNCNCTRQCTNILYRSSLSSAVASDYFINFMLSNILTNISKDDLVKDFGMVDIFYSDLTYQTIHTVPAYSLLSLFCDIGGAMGLILGSTVLTFFEILDFAIVSLWNAALFSMTPKSHK